MPDKDVADSTDWLSTPLAVLAAVEAALRCHVCKDFFNTPMITSCSHTFCSLCIRRSLSNDGKCPLCRKPEQEMKLRSNWSMEEAVEAFSKARPATLALASNSLNVEASSPKRRAEYEADDEASAPEAKRLRTSARLSNRNHSYAEEPNNTDLSTTEVPDPTTHASLPVENGHHDADYMPEPADGLVPCPMCQSRMKEWQVFKHIESCTGSQPQNRLQQPPTPQHNGENAAATGLTQGQRTQHKEMERLPALSYSLFKEQTLRKKMSELGLSSYGTRHLLERRHKEWITLWNANCDALRPKRRHELLQDLETWERTQGGRAAANRTGLVPSAPAVKDKEFDGAAWGAQHDDSFKDLIASARKSRQEASKQPADEQKPTTTESSSSAVAKTAVASLLGPPVGLGDVLAEYEPVTRYNALCHAPRVSVENGSEYDDYHDRPQESHVPGEPGEKHVESCYEDGRLRPGYHNHCYSQVLGNLLPEHQDHCYGKDGTLKPAGSDNTIEAAAKPPWRPLLPADFYDQKIS